MVQLHIATNNTGAKLSELSPIAYDQSTNSRTTLQASKSLDDEVSSPPRGWLASIGYAFWHLMETLESIKEKILRKQAPENLSNDEKETSSDGDEVHNHSKFSFKSIKNIFAWIPYFGSFFSTRNEIKKDTFETANSYLEKQEKGESPSDVPTASKNNVDSTGKKVLLSKVPSPQEIKTKTKEIIGTLKNQGIPRIPEDILPHLPDRDLEEIRSRLLMQCMRWNENRWCTKSAKEELTKCTDELKARKALQATADEQSAIENYNPKLSGDEEDEGSD